MRVLIVDDEKPARDKLHRLLSQEADVTALAEARDGVEALEQIAAFKPDVAFLDIQMPEVSGIELAASLPAPAPLIVFATAFDQYAIRAFDANAIDYLLKPYDQARLQRALVRVRERLKAPQAAPAFDSGHQVQQLLITERGVTRIIKVDLVQWIETADNYVVLHTSAEQPLMRQTLAGLLDKLGPRFMRCHRRAAVQLDWIESVVALDKGDCELVLRGGARVPCSRQYRAAVMEKLQEKD
jgi:two-component system LytT family response regulator